MNATSAFLTVKLVHTAVWAVFAGCIVAFSVAAHLGKFMFALVLIGCVVVEISVLALNQWARPLTVVVARYSSGRRDNFDIFLPPWNR